MKPGMKTKQFCNYIFIFDLTFGNLMLLKQIDMHKNIYIYIYIYIYIIAKT